MGIDKGVAQKLVVLERQARDIAIVTLNRPERANAINPEMARELDAAVKEVEADFDVRVAILTGAGGRVFSAGADLKIAAEGRIPELMTDDGGFAGFAYASRSKPWIAAIEGVAFAGGCELALACDMIVASRDAAFALPEVRRGLVAAAGGLFRMPGAIPSRIALELLLTGNRLSAERAAILGMVNRLADAGEALNGAIALAREISVNAPLAVLETLHIARRAGKAQEAEFRRLSDEAMDRLRRTDDAIEGSSAFVEKRKPVWLGR